MKCSFWKGVNRISVIICWTVGMLFIPFTGLFVYTPEYLDVVKDFLYVKIPLSRSVFFLMVLVAAFIISSLFVCISKFILEMYTNLEKLEKECCQLKLRLTENISNRLTESKKEKINPLLENFAKNYKEVISIQIYEVVSTNNKNKITYRIMPTHLKYVKGNESVNDVKESYIIDERKLNEYRKIKKLYLEKGDEKSYTKYLNKITKRLKSKSDSEITDAIIFDYCCLTLSYQYFFGENNFEIKDIDKNFRERIDDTKRNGFLRGIIEKDFYKFTHSGRSRKNNRIYITKCLPIQNVPHIFAITMSQTVLTMNNYSEFINQVGEKFYEILKKDSDVVYNDYAV